MDLTSTTLMHVYSKTASSAGRERRQPSGRSQEPSADRPGFPVADQLTEKTGCCLAVQTGSELGVFSTQFGPEVKTLVTNCEPHTTAGLISLLEFYSSMEPNSTSKHFLLVFCFTC